MGETFYVDSLEDMCAMMCDNVIPKKKKKGRDMLKVDKIVGVMVGVAVGDALGVPVEFMDWKSIRDKYGILDRMVGGGTWGQPAGAVSDDTMMALAVAEGIVKNPKDPVESIGEKFIEWYKGRPFDVGICCSSVIQNVMMKKTANKWDWFLSASDYDKRSRGRSGGNGGLMRTAFVGCYYKEPKDVVVQASDICGMTHQNSVAQTDCELMSLIIHELIDGGDKESIENLIMNYEDCNKRYDIGEIEGYPFNVKPNGYGVNSLACALKCVLTTRSFRDAVIMAVNMGGDTDTIGAITGAIAGALYGADSIPKEWIQAIDNKVMDRILKVSMSGAINRLGGSEKVVAEVCEWSKKYV